MTETRSINPDGIGYSTIAKNGYDVYGRMTSVTDAANNVNTTELFPVAGEVPSRIAETNALGHTTVEEIDARRGLTTATIDPNTQARRFHLRRSRPTHPRLDHWLAEGGPRVVPKLQVRLPSGERRAVVVTTSTLMHNGAYLTSYAMYDSLLRERQTQQVTFGGRLIAEKYTTPTAGQHRSSTPTTRPVPLSRQW
ncbi:hypothetical protein ACU686_13425 [Yinghuangia aomiensis]